MCMRHEYSLHFSLVCSNRPKEHGRIVGQGARRRFTDREGPGALNTRCRRCQRKGHYGSPYQTGVATCPQFPFTDAIYPEVAAAIAQPGPMAPTMIASAEELWAVTAEIDVKGCDGIRRAVSSSLVVPAIRPATASILLLGDDHGFFGRLKS